MPDGQACDDGNPCTIDDMCFGGICAGEPVDCSTSGNACNIASCDTNGNGPNCDVLTPFNDGGSCDDGNPCTIDDVCSGGDCLGDPVDCSTSGSTCADAACDTNGPAANCDLIIPINEGQSCDEGGPCTIDETCQNGQCVGIPMDCSTSGDQCNTAACDTNGTEGNCNIITPVTNGTPCDDDAVCTLDDACSNGVCFGDLIDCSAFNDQCNTASCDTNGATPNCDIFTPVADGEPCDDGQVCTLDDACQSGACTGDPIDCSTAGDQCNTAACDTNGAEPNCDISSPLPDGLDCNDGDPCTQDDACLSGACTGDPVVCISPVPECSIALCDTNGPDGNCDIIEPINEGGDCDDGDPCTVDEICSNGLCLGIPVDCTPFDTPCTRASCDPNGAEGNCAIISPVANGTTCDDGQVCTLDDACSNGICIGELIDCSTAGVACNFASCDTNGLNPNCDIFTPVADGEPCDDGQVCTLDDACQSGVCLGDPIDCSTAGDQCNTAACDTNGVEPNCDILAPVPDGLLCDDDNVCTLDDACQSGACLGDPVDCSTSGNACNVASCDTNGAAPNCDILTPVADGELCNDDNPCTLDDACIGGECLGDPVVCIPPVPECTIAFCDTNGPDGNCVVQPVNEGGVCDDNDVCTVDDACTSGLCIGIVLDTDSDGVPDCEDNCPDLYNPLQGPDCPVSPYILRVKHDAIGLNDGSSWYNAFNRLEDALAVAQAPGSLVNEIWVAGGPWVYTPPASGGRTATFQLLSGVAIRGGFAGIEYSRAERDFAGNITVLSGDVGVPDEPADNCYHVVTATGVDDTAILEGFYVTGGMADGPAPTGHDHGGGLIYDGTFADLPGPAIINCVFLGNFAADNGGGVWSKSFLADGLSLTNCAFLGNSAGGDGGGLYTRSGAATVANCTFYGNVAAGAGGGIYTEASRFAGDCPRNATITNCMLWGNQDGDGNGDGQQAQLAAVDSNCPPTRGVRAQLEALRISHCCIQAWAEENLEDLNVDSVGNFGDQPTFVDPAGPDGQLGTLDDNVRLDDYSAGIDAGENLDIPSDVSDVDSNGDATEPIPVDLPGNMRIINGTVDVGAYEFTHDCNDNGVIDFIDIAAGTSPDCNENQRPDECERDCNANGYPDDCDIAAGSSPDCNTNGVPDECDVAGGSSSDCDTNGLPDACELIAGSALDCNWNGIADVCDIQFGTSPDCNHDAVPDECELVSRSYLLDNANVGEATRLIEFDLATGVSRLLATLPPEGNDRGLTLIPDSNELLVTDQATSRLFRIDTHTRSIVQVVQLNLPILEIAYDWRRGILYGTATNEQLYTIDLATGTAEAVMPIPGITSNDWVCLAYDNLTDQLIGASRTERRLYFVDPINETSSAAPQFLGGDITSDLVVDPVNGTIYAVREPGVVYLVDRATGESTPYVAVAGVEYTIAGIAMTFPASPDCNANTIPDQCEVIAGTSPDCNTNGIPDNCDLAYSISTDCNTNGVPDECDIATGAEDDCNTNGLPDICELTAGTATDCNTNGTLDACELAAGSSADCNANAVPDACDIAGSTSLDCNTNALPDECEVAAGSAPDCNTNGAPDACDIADGGSSDCNTNALPDECEITAGSSADCNTNGAPDACDIADGTSLDCNATGVPDDCEPIAGGDFDADGQVTLVDFEWLPGCLGGPNTPPAPTPADCRDACLRAFDADDDGDVDLGDFARFQLAP